MMNVLTLREQGKSVKHLSFHPSGAYLALSGTDGIIYIYSFSTEQPVLLKKVEGVIQALDPESEATSKVAWHPNGRAFAVATATKGAWDILNSYTWDSMADDYRYCGCVQRGLGEEKHIC